MMKITLLVLLFATYAYCQSADGKYRVCVTGIQNSEHTCKLLESSSSEVKCSAALDSNDCAFMLKNSKADFGVFTADQIALVAPEINNHAKIISKIQDVEGGRPYKVRMGVVVKKGLSLSTLKGKNYCHPGFGDAESNDRIMKAFEAKVVRQECRDGYLAIENELEDISNYFGNMSCRPGKWTEDADQEAALRLKYSRLCAICDDTNSCSNNPVENDHHSAALRCVTELGGQVAYVSIETAENYFKTYSSYADKYSYLCPDDTTMDIGVSEPCSWYEEPLNAIVARSDIANDLRSKLNQWTTTRGFDWQSSLRELLLRNGALLPEDRKLAEYVKNITSSQESTSCGREIKWCTSSTMEKAKCETLKRAAALHAIKPEIRCIQGNSVWDCLNKTRNNQIDIVGIDTSLAYVAYKYYDVKNVMYQDTNTDDLYETIAVVKTGTANRFQDLEKKDACFPEFGSLAHISIFEKLCKEKKKGGCLESDVLGSFFGKTCVPRALQVPRDPRQADNAHNFCSLCDDKNCIIEAERSYFADAKAIQCMLNNTGSVAFINANRLKEILNDPIYSRQFRAGEYRFLCKDDRILPLNQHVDGQCAFGEFLSGMLVGSKNLSQIHLKDIHLALLKANELFGPLSNTWSFNMFGTYFGVDDLLFKGKTVMLISGSNQHANKLEDLMDSLMKCTISAGFAATSSIFIMSLAVSLSFLSFHRN